MLHVDKHEVDTGAAQELPDARGRKFEQGMADFKLLTGKKAFEICSGHCLLYRVVIVIAVFGSVTRMMGLQKEE